MNKSILIALLTILFLAGCGQSGPLYIPGDPSSIEAPPPPAGEEDDDDKDADSR